MWRKQDALCPILQLHLRAAFGSSDSSNVVYREGHLDGPGKFSSLL